MRSMPMALDVNLLACEWCAGVDAGRGGEVRARAETGMTRQKETMRSMPNGAGCEPGGM